MYLSKAELFEVHIIVQSLFFHFMSTVVIYLVPTYNSYNAASVCVCENDKGTSKYNIMKRPAKCRKIASQIKTNYGRVHRND